MKEANSPSGSLEKKYLTEVLSTDSLGVKRQTCVLLAPSDTSRTIPPQDSAAIAQASLPSQVLPPSPTQVTSAVLLTHWPQSPSSPRLSPPQHSYAQALHNDTTGNGPTSQTLASNIPPHRSQLLSQPSYSRPLALLFTLWGPPSINLPSLAPSIFRLDNKVHPPSYQYPRPPHLLLVPRSYPAHTKP